MTKSHKTQRKQPHGQTPKALSKEVPQEFHKGLPDQISEHAPRADARRISPVTCFHPLRGWRHKDGKIRSDRRGAVSLTPTGYACGQCSGCRLEKSRQWSLRCVHEASLHAKNSFLTLTYDDEHVPTNRSLDVRHWQLFAKALRHEYGSFRFYHCGEYGEQTHRLHLHALIFGLDFSDDRVLYRTTSKGHNLYTSERLDSVWQNGTVPIGAVTQKAPATARATP